MKMIIRAPKQMRDIIFFDGLIKLHQKYGHQVDWSVTDDAYTKKEYFGPIYKYSHAVIWRYFHSKPQEYNASCDNILFIDNSPLGQDYLYVDHLGFGGASSIVIKQENIKEIESDEYATVNQFATNFCLNHKYDRKGYILLSIYTDADTLKLCSQYLPNIPVIIRKPPSLKKKFLAILDPLLKLHSNWRLDDAESLYDSLGRARAVVTNLDDVACQASLMGIPVATVGRGLWSGSRATLDCTKNPKFLKTVNGFVYNEPVVFRYLSAILRKAIKKDANILEIENHPSIARFLEKNSSKEKAIMP